MTGNINTNNKGCLGGDAANGYGADTTTSNNRCVQGAGGYGKLNMGGGAYGGAGGTGSVPSFGAQTTLPGSVTAPILLGSGGGGYSVGNPAGIGGGRVGLTVSGTLTVSGSITANGQAGPAGGGGNGSGGGSGGSVYIQAGTLTGAGSISAAGGAGSVYAGGGGGGRIAIYYTTLGTFSLSSITATRGASGGSTYSGNIPTAGTNGTTFILDRYADDGIGNLRITSGMEFQTGVDYTRTNITIDSGAQMSCDPTAQTTVTISASSAFADSGSTWNCDGAVETLRLTADILSTTGTMWGFTAATSTYITATTWYPGAVSSTMVMSQIGSSSTWNISNNFSLTQFRYVGASAGRLSSSGGWLSIKNAISLTMVSSTITSSVSSTQLSALSIDSNSSVSANGKGCEGQATAAGYGPDETTGLCTASTSGYGRLNFGGAGHGGAGSQGGLGGLQVASATYGSSTLPILPGSGGAGWNSNGATQIGGYGGGLIILRSSGTFTLNGNLSANGTAQTATLSNGSGGGSGGTINIWGATLTGTTTLSTNGGGGIGYGGGGGGGRISVRYSSLSATITSSTSGGTGGIYNGAGTGSTGSVYNLQTNQNPDVPASLGQTGLVNGSTTGTTNPVFTFTLSDPDASDTVKFEIQIDDSADFGSAVVDYTSALAAEGDRTFQVGQAAGTGSYSVGSEGQTLNDGSYYWRVKTIDAAAAASSYTTANGGAVAFVVDSVVRNIQFIQAAGTELESVTASSVRVVLSQTHFENISVNYAVSGGSAEGGGVDYTLASGSLTINAGDTSGTIDLTVVNDQIDEPDETLIVALTSPTFASLGVNDTLTYTIQDNDTAGITVSAVAGSPTEGGGNGTYTVVLNSKPTSTVSVALTGDPSRVTLSDASLSFTSGNWDTPQTVTITAVNDSIDQPTTATSVTHLASSSFAYGYNSALVISDASFDVVDNDTAGVTISAISGSATEGGGTATYTVVLDSKPTSTVSVALAADPSQITLSDASLSFTTLNWDTPQTVTVTAYNDQIAEASVATSVTHLTSSNFAYGYDSSLVISSTNATILDNDSAGVTISAVDGSPTEGGSTATYTVVLDSKPTSTVTVALLGDPSRVSLSDSTLSFTTLNWDTPQTVTLTAVNDSIDQPTTATSVTQLASSSFAYGYNSALVISSADFSVVDNDTAGVTVSAISGSATEGGGTATYTVVLDSQPTSTVSVALAADPSQITLSDSSLSFTNGNWDTPQTVTVTAYNDQIAEASVATSVTHLASSSFAYGYSSSLVISSTNATILDNDSAGVNVSAVTGSPTEGGGNGTYTLVLNSKPTSTVSVALTGDPSRVSLSDSTLSFTTLNWDTPQTVTLTAVNDSIDQPTTATSVTHLASSSFAYGYNSSLVIGSTGFDVVDNDTAGVTVSDLSGPVTEGGSTATYTLVLNTQPTSTVSVALTADPDQLSLSDSSISFTNGNWNIAQTITVTAVNDLIAENGFATSVTHLASSSFSYGYSSALVIGIATTTVVDNDTAGVTLSKGYVTTTENAAGDSYTMVLTSQPTANVSILMTTGTQVYTGTGTFVFTSGNWNVPQTVSVNAVDDTLVEGPHTGLIRHTPSSADAIYAAVTIGRVTSTIYDDDSNPSPPDIRNDAAPPPTVPSIGFHVVSAEGPESSSPVSITLDLSQGYTQDVSVDYAASGGSATNGVDYSLSAGTLFIPAGQVSRAINLTILNDVLTETNETISVTLTNPMNATLNANNVFTYTIINDDIQPATPAASSAAPTPSAPSAASPAPAAPAAASPTPVALPVQTVPAVSYFQPPSETPAVVSAIETAPIAVAPVYVAPLESETRIVPPSDPLQLTNALGRERNETAEVRTTQGALQDAQTFHVELSQAQASSIGNYVTYGISERTIQLGEGERRAVIRDYLETTRRSDVVWEDVERIVNGEIPTGSRNLDEERRQLVTVRSTFKRIVGHSPVFSKQADNLAWNTLMYRIRPGERDTAAEADAIKDYRSTFRRIPRTPLDWAAVRVYAYVLQ